MKIVFSKKGMPVIVGISFLLASNLQANPVLDHVDSGSALIQQSAQTTTINQTSDKAIINWQSFNIGADETTHFQQPAGGITLNRINPAYGVSDIYGHLTATGQVILVNPAGIFFGPSAYVNVGGLIATTANITNQDFLNGNYQFSPVAGYNGAITNQGQIIAANHGLVALVGNNVTNNGLIQANLGHVVLAATDAFTISFAGNDLINFAINTNQTAAAKHISNTGSLIANGGQILVTAKAAQGVLDEVINMQGIAQARSFSKHNGEIIFSGGDQGIVKIAGKIDVSGRGRGSRGGKVQITGQRILIDNNAAIDASGDSGGGEIDIGGEAHGLGLLPHASATVVMPNATLLADAISSGNGGTIIIWADEVTRAYGNLSARGGALAGNGGFIETSSPLFLDVSGIHVDTMAPQGSTGQWLLDPWNVTISNAATTNGTFNSSNPDIYTPVATGANVNTTDIDTNLNTANVTITTGTTGAEAGNITVINPISNLATTNTLLLTAAGNIILNAGINLPNGSLQLSAGTPTDTITTSASGTINVNNFNLLRGQWNQVSNPLPAFNATTNFQIDSGNMPSTNAQFIRALSGNGTVVTPYVIADIYGLQGIGSNTATLGLNYVLNNAIDASETATWNSGIGFVPIGNTANFTGVFDGQNNSVNNLFINKTSGSPFQGFGFFGNNSGTIKNIQLLNATIKGFASFTNMGGLVGNNSGLVDHAIVSGNVSTTVNFNSRIGGLVGFNTGTISNSSSSATVKQINPVGGYSVIGDLVGDTSTPGTISNSFATGLVSVNVSGSLTDGQFGGLVGAYSSNGNISNSYSTASVIINGPSASLFAGGLVGDKNGTGVISNSFSTGYVNVTNGVSGGLIGNVSAGTVANSFWDPQTSGQVNGVGSGPTTGVTGDATAALMQQATYPWDFVTIWGIIPGQSYPYLRWFSPAVPRVISSASPAGGNSEIDLVINGTAINNNTHTGANGFFYFLTPNGTIADNVPFLAFIKNGTTTGNIVGVIPNGGNSITDLSMLANTLKVGRDSTASTLNAALVSAAKGALSDPNILFSVAGNNITLAAGNSFVSSLPTNFNLDGNINTTNGNIILGGPSTLNTNANLTANGSGNVAISINGVTGNHDLNLNGGGTSNVTFSLNNTLAVNNITVSGSPGGNNTLSVNDAGNPQDWIISGTNTGSISNIPGLTGTFNFNNIQNLIGGNGANQFTFLDNALITGLINGGLLSNTDTLDYTAYSTPVFVSLATLNSGSTQNNASTNITSFININNLTANLPIGNKLQLPNKHNILSVTGPGQGFINDPTNFSGFNFLISSSGNDIINFLAPGIITSNDTAIVDGITMTFQNFNLFAANQSSSALIADVLFLGYTDTLQPNSNWTFVNENMNQLMEQTMSEYMNFLNNLRIDPNCSGRI